MLIILINKYYNIGVNLEQENIYKFLIKNLNSHWLIMQEIIQSTVMTIN